MSDFDGFDDFEEMARRAGRGLGAVVPAHADPKLARQRLQRRRIATATAAIAIVVGVSGGIALARDNDHTKIHIANQGSTTTAAPTSTTAPDTSTTAPSSTTVVTQTVPPPVTSIPPASWLGPPVVCVIDGNVVGVSVDGPVRVTTDGGYTLAYLLSDGEIRGRADSVVVQAASNGPVHTIPDVTLIGTGKYQNDDVAIVLDLHPDVLHDNWKWVSLYDLRTGTLRRTQLSIAPGTTLDHVSIAGDLFVMSGKSDEGGPFVLYRHVDGTFDDSLPNVVAGQPGIGAVSDAVISPDGTRIAYIVDGKKLRVSDVHSGRLIQQFENSDAPPYTALDFDGRFAVVSQGPRHLALAVDTSDARMDLLPNTGGTTTIVPQ